MLVAVTGTPGTGKSSLSAELRRRGHEVVDADEHIRKNGLLGEWDALRDTYEVDVGGLNDSLEQYRGKGGTVFLDSHLSHHCDCSAIIVLRCEPKVLAGRLRARGYPEAKVRENVQAECLDVILCEAADTGIPVAEIDCTAGSPAEAADLVERIIKGGTAISPPGGIDWSPEMGEWF